MEPSAVSQQFRHVRLDRERGIEGLFRDLEVPELEMGEGVVDHGFEMVRLQR
jgi:hypothetical protein